MSTEGTTTIEKESEEAYLLRLKQNGDENNKYTKKTSIRFSSHFKWFLVILLCLLSWLVLYEFIRSDNFPIVGIPKRHRRAWKPGLDWFPTDPYTLDAAYYDQFKNRTEVPNKCPASAQSFIRLANVIEIFSVGHNGLYWMGGTGHWFHFAERVLPMLTPAHEQVWGPNSIVSPELREEIFLVFAEVRAATTLGTFGRFFLTSILTGGKYKVVHICSASSVLYEGLGVGVDNGERSLVQDLRIHFTIDLSQQDIHDLFVKNFPDKRQDKVHSYICAKTLLQVPLIGYRRMFHWFTHYENVTKFRDSYSDMCGISYSTNETYVRRTRRTQMSASSSHHKPSKNREVGWSNVNKSRKKRSRLRWRLASSDRIEASHTPLNVQINDANDIESNGSSSIGAYGTLSVDRAEGEIRSDYELELGMRDDLEVVRDHGGLRRDPSVYNPFFKNITHNYRKIEIPPLHVIHEKGKQKLLLYQRDASRKVRGVDMFVESLKQQLSATNSTIENSADWEIDLHSHRENGPPCEIIQKLSQTTAFVTAHGFQAFLLIYLPNTALVAEVFPALYYVPTYYGELQLTYRARFGFQRSYLSYESATMTNVMHYGAKLMWGKTHLCRRNIVCRHLSRAQDVKISDEFTKTIAAFLKYNFRK